MARPLRIEHEGAIDHILSRDSARQAIFLGDHDREKLLTDLEEPVVRCGWELFSYNGHLKLKTRSDPESDSRCGNDRRGSRCLDASD